MNVAHGSGAGTPVVTVMQVIPVAGQDSMLLNLCGAHAPYFTRNLVILKDSSGHTGIGEVPGGEGIRQALDRSRELVIGKSIGLYNGILNAIRQRFVSGKAAHQATVHQVTSASEAKVLKQPHEINLRMDNVITAVEAALLDLLGQHLGVPVCELLGAGKQRDAVRMLSYLFYIGDRRKTDLPYLGLPETKNDWYRLRHEPAMDAAALVRLAEASVEQYGFADFKLKGGVMSAADEIEAITAIKKRFPQSRVTLDPNGAWSLEDAIKAFTGLRHVMA